MLKKFDVITIGGVARDVIFFTEEGRVVDNKSDLTKARLACFESGAKIIVDEANFSLGGGASNTAVAFARLGLKTGVIAKTGKDREAEKIIEEMQEEGVDTSFIDQTRLLARHGKKTVTGFSFIVGTGKDMEHTAFLYRGANDELQVNEPLLSRIKTSWIYAASLSGNNWPLILRNVGKHVYNSKHKPGTFKKAKGVKFAWNPGQVQIEAGKRRLEKFLEVTDVLILNKDEATELVMSDTRNVKSEAQLKNTEFLLRTIQGWGPEIVVITSGEKGAHVIWNQQVYFHKAKKVKTKDTTGAGDAFGAGFVAGLELFKDTKKALELGILNGARVVTEVGAQEGLMRRDDI
ncbi:carbohydrate kinase family protein [Candidatus Falkowbacteria bacterium]|nr:carbohydrate kinase family protein [Candidatus Falkowbacteria bacterium]